MLGSDGNFYGTTTQGGSSDANGTAFKMTASGTLTTLVNFTGVNGYDPKAGLVHGRDGNFYGTTRAGGSSGSGTVFKMTPSGTLTTLVHFTGANGREPYAGLVQGSDGNFYGTTFYGGSGFTTTDARYGTVFKMTPAGTLTTLVNFTSTNGRYPKAELVQGNDGNFYGTTIQGGSSSVGTVFNMTPAGTLTTLVNFTGSNGAVPYAGLMQGSDGNFYGTTQQGGSSAIGTAFKMTASGTLTTLVNFTGGNGSLPQSGLVRGSDGNLYGTTNGGGTTSEGQPAGGGQIYRLRMGPTVTSRNPSNVTATSATLNGTVNPGGYATTVSFQYGTDPTLATFSSASAGTLSAGTTDMTVQATISGLLLPETTYYYRVLASNVENTVPQYGAIRTLPDAYAFWAFARFTSAQLADPLISGPNADPDKDGLVNLLERAFNLNPNQAALPILIAGTGTSGLPLIRRTGQPPVFSIQYLRRKASSNPGLTYAPQVSSVLGADWATATGVETVESIDSEWERVTVEESATGQPKRFGRVKVTSQE